MNLRWQIFFAWLVLLGAVYGVIGFAIQGRQFEARLSSAGVKADSALPGQVLLETKSGVFLVSQREADAYNRGDYIEIGFLILVVVGARWLANLRRRTKAVSIKESEL